MEQNRFRGPLMTLAAITVVGGTMWAVSVSQGHDVTPVAPVAGAAAPERTTAPVATPPTPAPFPTRAHYVAEVPTAMKQIVLEVTINGAEATAYACDGDTLETWLRGSAAYGQMALTSKDATSTLDGHLEGDALVGTLVIGAKSWPYTATQDVHDVG